MNQNRLLDLIVILRSEATWESQWENAMIRQVTVVEIATGLRPSQRQIDS